MPETLTYQPTADKTNYQVSKQNARQFELDLRQIDALQNFFDTEIGVQKKKKEVIRSYNPVLPRWKYEQLATEDERTMFRRNELKNQETNLRERCHAERSIIYYKTDSEGNAYNEHFPDEPFENVLGRGVEYRRRNGSPELTREEMELDGYRDVQALLTDKETPLHTKAIVISSPGLVEGTTYTDNFVDIYEAEEDPLTKERVIKMTRHASEVGNTEYFNKVLEFDKDYFSGADGIPFDAWLLRNPIIIDPKKDKRTAEEIFQQEFKGQQNAMSEQVFQEYYKACLPCILYYIDKICAEEFNPQETALAFNAILKKEEIIRKSKRVSAEETFSSEQVLYERSMFHQKSLPMAPVFRSIQEEVSWLGRQKIESVRVGCGLSAGFVVGGNSSRVDNLPQNSVLTPFSNSVAKFAESKRILCCTCPFCKKQVEAVIASGKISCPECSAEADWTEQVAQAA